MQTLVVQPGEEVVIKGGAVVAEVTAQPDPVQIGGIPKPTAFGKDHALKTELGKRPLCRVLYTPKGKTEPKMYGVFWSGVNPDDHNYPGHQLGLQHLTKDGKLTKKYNRFAKTFFVDASKCKFVD